MDVQQRRQLSHTWTLLLALLIIALLPFQEAEAGENFVGDGFGGRSWYVPSGFAATDRLGAYVDPSGQLYMWGLHSVRPSIAPISSPLSDGSWTCSYPVAGFDNVKLIS
ncbi:MAG: hypothetical protein KDE47_15900, partial [Caldilineaceae bacterium]|nr:hypothetical protein [Caldilineaceae bacterium]